MSLKKNVVANYLGQAWTGLMGIVFVPLYIKYLGIEAYGLIGVFIFLQAWLAVLDAGMTPTLNREVARYVAGAHTAESIRNLVFTFEVICAGAALLVILVLASSSNWLAHEWFNAQGITQSVVSETLSTMGVVSGLRFFEGLYRGAILGFQKHVWLNIATSILATLRALGAIAVLAWVEPSIQAFFWWQVVISGVTVVILFFGVHRQLPNLGSAAIFSTGALSESWKFAAGILATTLLTLLITQVDKVLLSRLVSLEEFGVYAFSTSVVGVLFQLIGPIAQAYYPKLTELVTTNNRSLLSKTYHQGAQLLTIMVTPAGLVLVAFGEPLILAWTGNQILSNQASAIVAILAIGTVFNGWVHMPYMLQLASGWSSFSVWVNFVGAIVLIPAILWAIPNYGPIGAAWVWVAVNAGYVFFSIPFMHVRLLQKEKFNWYFFDIAIPAGAAGAVVALSYFAYHPRGPFLDLIWIGLTGILACIAAILSASELRAAFLSHLNLFKNSFVK